MSKLVVHLGSLPLLELTLAQGTTRLGRARNNDIVLSLPEVAEHQASVTLSGNGAILRTLDGEPLLVNGRAATETPLVPGDMIGIGGYRIHWLGDRSPEAVKQHTTEPLADPPAADERPVRGLVVASGRDAGIGLSFDRPTVLVGRAPDCDLVLRDETVTWRHLLFERLSGGLKVRDLGSRNGTLLDGRRIESAVTEPGARIRIGRTVLELTADAPGASAERAGLKESPESGLAEMVGRSGIMRDVYARIREAAANRLPVLLLGETGTGKELAARAIHALAACRDGPFVPVNCAALPRDLMEAELFGHTRGSFTGANAERRGAFEEADRGIIFLDEISELPIELQPKLLRVIEDGHVPRIGGGGGHRRFRVLAASNRDLAAGMNEGRFRRDLYFRLAAVSIQMPPLSDRIEDLSELVRAFLATADEQTGVAGAGAARFDEEAFTPLREYSWPGNVRQLRNVVLAAAVRRPAGVVDRALVEAILADHPPAVPCTTSLPVSLEEMEREAIRNALRDSNGHRRAAARRLGIAESTLYEKIRRFGLASEGPASRR